MKHSRILSRSVIILAAVVSAVSLFAFYNPAVTHADPSCIQYGGFNHSVAFIEAQQRGFFAREGLNVCYNQVSGSQQQINGLLAGQYQFIASTADNAVNQYVNNNEPLQIVAGGDQGAGLDLIVNTANGIHSIADLKGKTVAVDAPNSGFVFATEKILAANGLSLQNGDYSLQVIGGSLQRFQAISAGHTASGDPVYATILGTPFVEQAHQVATLSDLAQFSSYVALYQGTSLIVTRSYAQANPATVTNFIAALMLGNAYALNPAHRSEVLTDIANVDGVSTQIAKNIYTDSRDPMRGENIATSVNVIGLRNTINLRQEFGGFNTPVNSWRLVQSNPYSVYYDRYWKAAVVQAIRYI